MLAAMHRSTLIDEFFPATTFLGDVVLIIGFSILTALSAQLSIWIGPVPITGQTFAVLLTGALLGSRRGAISMMSYLAIGATGMPFWFALGGPAGVSRLFGPTGGYLFGFVLMAYIVGRLAEKGWDRHIVSSAAAMLAGSAVMYISGLLWLYRFVPGRKVFELGLYPFITGDILKIALATLSLPAGWRLLKTIRERNQE